MSFKVPGDETMQVVNSTIACEISLLGFVRWLQCFGLD